MTHPLPSPLSTSDRVLLCLMVRFVPVDERADWLRCWRAELWHRRHPRARVSGSAVDLYPGLISDAMWLRLESWREAFTGTASLCIASLVGALFFSMLPLLVLFEGVHGLGVFVSANTNLFLCEGTLVALVSFATSSRVVEHVSPAAPLSRLRTQMFLAAKLVLVLMITFLLSEDLTQILHAGHPFTAEILQPQFFVVMALLGQRWNFSDQDSRCKHCLRVLSLPARVGRPSWNFLDSNGTELLCKDGHGLLSVPEIETSWRPSSCWIDAT